MEKEKKRKPKWAWIVIAAVTLIAAVYFGIKIGNNVHTAKEYAKEQALIQEKLDAASKRQEELKAKKNRELTLEERIEILRNRFGLLFPNEIMFIPKQ